MPSHTVDGSKWAASHQASVDAILSGKDRRTVSARGSMFMNIDRWTGRAFLNTLCNHLRWGNLITPDVVRSAVSDANLITVAKPEIVVATVPDKVPGWLQRASVGGNYHEAWHTEWSCRRDITFHEVWPEVSRVGALLPPDEWQRYFMMLLTWSNIVEDIRIERLGCRKYPGAGDKLANLQDLILRMEDEGRAASEHAPTPGEDAMYVVTCAFRDLGLGYDTERGRKALARYAELSPEGLALVQSGPLRPFLDRTIGLGPEDDLACIWLAMEIVATLATLDRQPEPEDEPDDEPDPGKGKGNEPPPLHQFRVGDRATAKTGPHAGKVVEVTFASPPDPETGRQTLKFAPVEDED
jgi:hypothetical protein